MKNAKKVGRIRRSRKTRARIKILAVPRLCVHKTAQHIYAQIIVPGITDRVVVSVSTLNKKMREALSHTSNIEAAARVGEEIATLAIEAGIKRVAFDRSGHAYHGRIKALASSAREKGLEF